MNNEVIVIAVLFQRDPFPTILSPILRSQLTGYPGYPQIKQEPGTEQYQSPPAHMKAEYYSGGADQLPHSTVGSLVDPRHPRHHLDALTGAARSKPNKPPKPRPVSVRAEPVPTLSILAQQTPALKPSLLRRHHHWHTPDTSHR